MAEGGVEEDNSEMLGPTLAPVLQTMQTPAPSNLSNRDEVCPCVIFIQYITFRGDR